MRKAIQFFTTLAFVVACFTSVHAQTVNATLSVTTTPTTCGENNGTATASVTGASSDVTYLWSNGETTATITGLTPGSFTVTAFFDDTSLSKTVAPGGSSAVNAVGMAFANSCGEANGSAEVRGFGGGENLSFEWSNGASSTGSDSDLLTNLFPGDYTVTVTSALTGCFDIITLTVPERAAPDLTVSATDPTCAGDDGTATADISIPDSSGSGTPSVATYVWSSGETTANISDLSAGDYTVTASISGCTAIQTVTLNEPTGCDDVTYCESEGESTEYEWIKQVKLSNVNNWSGDDGGYGDYTDLTANLNPGYYTLMKLRPGFSGYSYREYWRVWIDWNQDGDFDDYGEFVGQGNGFGLLVGYIYTPYSALPGDTRMRVSMKYGGYSQACGNFAEGEVEDYTIHVNGSGGSLVANPDDPTISRADERTETVADFISEEGDIVEMKLSVYPNPANDYINVDYGMRTTEDATITVSDITGRTVMTQEIGQSSESQRQGTLTISDLQKGTYFVTVRSGQDTKTVKFMKL
jgi:hypothetical protein